jgi:hypothetical protein
MNDRASEEIHRLFERIAYLAAVGAAVEDPRYCRQLLCEICYLTAEYVTK